MSEANPAREELLRRAAEATRHAVAPYSGIRVAAALRTKAGEVVTGVNVESASYGLTCCAERVALFAALAQGHRDFLEMALVSSVEPCLLPCGACRQLLAEYAPKVRLWCASLGRLDLVREKTVVELLPEALVKLPDAG